MTTLYLDHKTTKLRIRAGVLEISHSERGLASLPLKLLERVIIRSDMELSAGTLTALSNANIGLTIITGRKGEKIAHLVGAGHNDARRRLAQYQCYLNEHCKTGFARRLIAAKTHNQLRFVQRLRAARPDARYRLEKARQTIERIVEQIPQTTTLDTLRGQEGAAASAAFDALAAVLPPALGFSGRNRRPPRDPVNAVLSLAYTLAHADAIHACHITGADPLIGMLHELSHGRASLASDLIEPLRPPIDYWVWELFRTRREGEACLLGKAGRQRFYSAWETRAPAMRRWLRRQATGFIKYLCTEKYHATTLP